MTDESPIRVLFIANRGEIAARVVRTAERLGIWSVAAATEGPLAVDLLDADAVIAAARAVNADAIHPGYGFLSESPSFAAAVVAAGMRWIGPPAAAIGAMGDKAAARRLAASLGVPTVPGYDGPDQSDGALRAAAERLGVPLLVKPSAGGGGKGMRIVRSPEALDDALASARREARAAFGDDRLILERFVEGPRHVEIQLLFDAHGSGIHLGERDCSLQRRHQKVLEESPSPAMSADLRERMGDAALRLAGAVGYVSAGTVEFLLDDRGAFYFLEMNARLQVEHPVTELVSGRDLVEDQLRIAAGQRLSELPPVRFSGHAVEARIYAEDAEDGFLPAVGRVHALKWPAGDGVRVDAGIDVRSEVTGRFDPMLTKIIAFGLSRGEALDRLTEALDQTVILGVVTNLRFLRWLVRQPVLLDGNARIDSLERIWPPDGWAAAAATPEAAWQTAATELASEAAPGDPWAGGWRLNAPRQIGVSSEGETRAVRVGSEALPALASARVEGTVFVDVAGRSVAFTLASPPSLEASHRRTPGGGSASSAEIHAPMPGAVLQVHARAGTDVDAGQPIVTLEAMKMEHVVAAPVAGTLTEVLVAAGDQVSKGQLIAMVGD